MKDKPRLVFGSISVKVYQKTGWNIQSVFVVNSNHTYEHYDDGVNQKNVKVWIFQPGAGLEKRQCSLHVCLREAEGKQPKIAIIFRGKGFIGRDKRLAYHSDVDVLFQQNTWADRKVSLE